MSRYLVTGGVGFIGGHIVEELVRRKHFVRVLDNFSSGKEDNIRRVMGAVEIIREDIRSKDSCDRACRGMDFVLHQAALRSVPKSMSDPESYNEVNIGGTLNMLQAAAGNKVKRFVFASSSSVYGDVSEFPQKEEFSPQPISPYALSKLAGEHYCKIFSCHWGLETVSLRYFNVFGPRQALDDEYAVVVPKFISCILKGDAPPVYGTGKQSRDFTYVSNVVDANILASGCAGARGRAFNVALGKDYSVLELVKILNSIIGKKIKPVFLDKRPGDVYKTLADISSAKKILGFVPAVDFHEGLARTVEFFKNNG